MRPTTRTFTAMLFAACLTAGCSSSMMQPVPPDTAQQLTTPTPDEAVLVIMRPSVIGGAIQSSVFEVTADDNKLVGIVSTDMKVAYRVSAGEHMFMVIGENADFMRAQLEAGKTYYAYVQPRMGVWKARFSLVPIRRDELDESKFAGWNRGCKLHQTDQAALEWAEGHADSIMSKREGYWPRWEAKSEEEKAEYTLRPEDGM